MYFFTYKIERIFTSPITIFLIGFLSTFAASITLNYLTKKAVHFKTIISAICSIAYGFLFITFQKNEISFPIAIMAIITPLLATLTIILTSRDNFYSYLFIFLIMLCNYSCIYIFSISWFHYFPKYEIQIGTANFLAANFVLAGILTIVYELAVYKFGKPILQKVRRLVQSRSQGILFFFYMLNLNTGMILLAIFVMPRLLRSLTPISARNSIATFGMLFSAIALIGSYLVIFIQYKLEKSINIERMYRNALNSDAILNYSYNASKQIIPEEYRTIFNTKLYKDSTNFRQITEKLIKAIAHPDDVNKLLELGDYNNLKHIVGNSFSIRAKFSPTNLMDLVSLSPRIIKRLTSSLKEWRWGEIIVTAAKEESTDDIIVYITVNDVDDTVSYENILKRTAQLDPLTGVYNRGELENRVKKLFVNKNINGALIILDVDYFKSINDTLGHITGDSVLKEIASTICAVFREDDIVARLGGDEFCIFTTMNNKELIEKRMTELNKRAYKTITTPSGKTVTSSVSIGVALCPSHGTQFDELYLHADTALYNAKESGRNTWRIYEPKN